MFNLKDIKELHMETSSGCNAACPMCPRETNPLFDKQKDARHLSLNQVKTLFDENFIKNLHLMFMCGGYGDPAAAPECLDILRYFRQVNPNVVLAVHTNGGLRSKSWWAELGSILNQREDRCVFSIDGLEDTNHLYRINVKFDKLMENVTSFIGAGGIAHWSYLVFRHNEHQIEQAKTLASTMGFKEFHEKASPRFITCNLPFPLPPLGQYKE